MYLLSYFVNSVGERTRGGEGLQSIQISFASDLIYFQLLFKIKF